METSLQSEGKASECTESSDAAGKQDDTQSSQHESHEDMVVKLEVVDSETSSDQTVLQLRASANVNSAPVGGKFIIMDEFEDELLIAEVKKSPILYDKNHVFFKNLGRKRAVWEDVGEQIGMDGEIAKKRWINIRDAFQAYLNRLLAASSSHDPRTIKKYKYAHLLDFLLAHMKKGRFFKSAMQAVESSSAGSSSLNMQPSCSATPDISVSDDQRNSSEEGKKPDTRVNYSSKSSIRHTNKRKRQLENTVSRQMIKYRQLQRALVSTRDEDGTESFFKAMAAAVGRLPNRAKAEVKLQIHQLVQQAELKYLYPINDPQVSQGPSGRSEEDSIEVANQSKARNVEGTD